MSIALLAVFLSLSSVAPPHADASMSDAAARANEIVMQPIILAGKGASALVLWITSVFALVPGAPIACVAGAIADGPSGCTKGANAAGNAITANVREGVEILTD
jgi:hypothetical protein